MKNDCTYPTPHLKDYILENTPQRVIERYKGLASYAQNHDFGILEDVVVIDTETTGFSFNHDELIQIAAARMHAGEIVNWYTTFVNPGQLIPDEITHLTHISQEHVENAPSPAEALQDLVEFVGDLPLIAHNATFDRTFVTKTLEGEPLQKNVWIDSLDLARIVLPRFSSHRLLDLVRAFGGPDSTHRADDDVVSTCLVYRILLAGVATMPSPLVAHIAQMSTIDEWNTVYVFQQLADPEAPVYSLRKSRALAVNDEIEQVRHDAFAHAEHVARETELLGGIPDGDTICCSNNNVPHIVYAGQKPSDEIVSRETIIVGINPDGTPLFESDTFDGSIEAIEVEGYHEFNHEDIHSNVSRETLLHDDSDNQSNDYSQQNSNAQEQDSIFITSKEQSSSLRFATDAEIEAAFAPEGLVGTLYESYEVRQEQIEMSLAVNRALTTSTNLAVEAGTGVGKSMAYLVPLAYAARYNNITVGVATKTNALLDQLVNKELPLLQKALGITYAPLKGFTHYLCNRKINRIVEQGPQYVTWKGDQIHQAPALAGLLSFIDQTDFDDMDALKIDFRALPKWQISTKSAECLRRKCPFYGRSCFVHGARDQAQRSDVVVTNHSLLFWDVRYEGELLPPIRFWAVDEAHGAEDEARSALATALASEQIRSLVRRVASEEARHNVFLRAERNTAITSEAKHLFDALISKACKAGGAYAMAAEEFCLRVKDLLYFDPQSKKSGYEYSELWLNEDIRQSSIFAKVAGCAQALNDTLDALIKASRDIVAYLESLEITTSEQREIALVALELREIQEALGAVFTHQNSNQVYSVRLNRAKDKLNEVFTVQPLDVGALLNETLYQNTYSIVYTSATLSVDKGFESFEQAMGLNQSSESRTNTVQVNSSYDFDTQMRIYIPEDMPEPQDARYLPALQELLTELHLALQGSLLTLFTNRRDMERCFDQVNPVLKEHELRLVCQKWGVSTKGLRDDFLKDEHLSLFALKSFWEGFDAPGATLKGVIIPKLPFGLPTDPLSCERALLDEHAWAHYSLPAAVIETKQAVGRLIRTASDEGIVVLADKRLLTKYYGKKFLNSLPSTNIQVLPKDEIVTRVAEFAAKQTRDE